jgi:hypothetical protein
VAKYNAVHSLSNPNKHKVGQALSPVKAFPAMAENNQSEEYCG